MYDNFEKTLWEANDFQRQAAFRAEMDAGWQYSDALTRQHDAEVWNGLKEEVGGLLSWVFDSFTSNK